jgi:hypothetical protein
VLPPFVRETDLVAIAVTEGPALPSTQDAPALAGSLVCR